MHSTYTKKAALTGELHAQLLLLNTHWSPVPQLIQPEDHFGAIVDNRVIFGVKDDNLIPLAVTLINMHNLLIDTDGSIAKMFQDIREENDFSTKDNDLDTKVYRIRTKDPIAFARNDKELAFMASRSGIPNTKYEITVTLMERGRPTTDRPVLCFPDANMFLVAEYCAYLLNTFIPVRAQYMHSVFSPASASMLTT